MDLPFHKADYSHKMFQYLEDVSTAYWFSEVLFAALDLNIFEHIDHGSCKIDNLAEKISCKEKELYRLLRVLCRMKLLHKVEDKWFNSQLAGKYLVSDSPSYIGNFLFYRQYLQSNWKKLVEKISFDKKGRKKTIDINDSYEKRTFYYVRAMDELMREKAWEISKILSHEIWKPEILDVGGGAGALSRVLVKSNNNVKATLFELPEVVKAASKLYPFESDWFNIKTMEGDFRKYAFKPCQSYDLILFSNLFHIYNAEDTNKLLKKAVSLLKPGGIILIHDYFADRLGPSPYKGALYDLNIMLNTFEGECHESSQIIKGLKKAGMIKIKVRDLSSDSSVIIAGTDDKSFNDDDARLKNWVYKALDSGFEDAVLISTDKIATGSWVRVKCRYGCKNYGRKLQCPPLGIDLSLTKDIIGEYESALVLEGMPPGINFYDNLLKLEKKAFLDGLYKAFAFGAGPCPYCKSCPSDGICLFPDKARPSMEGSGIDVYKTAQNAGIRLEPVLEKGQYIKYIGLLLLE